MIEIKEIFEEIVSLDTSELRFRSVQNLFLELETRPLTEAFRMHGQRIDGTSHFKINQKEKRWDQNYREHDPICFNLLKFTSYFLQLNIG